MMEEERAEEEAAVEGEEGQQFQGPMLLGDLVSILAKPKWCFSFAGPNLALFMTVSNSHRYQVCLLVT